MERITIEFLERHLGAKVLEYHLTGKNDDPTEVLVLYILKDSQGQDYYNVLNTQDIMRDDFGCGQSNDTLEQAQITYDEWKSEML